MAGQQLRGQGFAAQKRVCHGGSVPTVTDTLTRA